MHEPYHFVFAVDTAKCLPMNSSHLYSTQIDVAEAPFLVCLVYTFTLVKRMRNFLSLYYLDHLGSHHHHHQGHCNDHCVHQWGYRVVYITTGRTIRTSTSIISSSWACKVPLLVTGGCLMQTIMSMLSVASMVATFLLRISLWFAWQEAFMSSMRAFFRINLPRVSTGGTLPWSRSQWLNHVWQTIHPRRIQCRGCEVRNYRRHMQVPISTTHIMICLMMTMRRVIWVITFMISCLFWCRILQWWAYIMRTMIFGFTCQTSCHVMTSTQSCGSHFHNTGKVSWAVQSYLQDSHHPHSRHL